MEEIHLDIFLLIIPGKNMKIEGHVAQAHPQMEKPSVPEASHFWMRVLHWMTDQLTGPNSSAMRQLTTGGVFITLLSALASPTISIEETGHC